VCQGKPLARLRLGFIDPDHRAGLEFDNDSVDVLEVPWEDLDAAPGYQLVYGDWRRSDASGPTITFDRADKAIRSILERRLIVQLCGTGIEVLNRDWNPAGKQRPFRRSKVAASGRISMATSMAGGEPPISVQVHSRGWCSLMGAALLG
jgi:hypothetical protein